MFLLISLRKTFDFHDIDPLHLSFLFRIATNGILITAATLFFMKDLLATFIHSVFKYFLNPTIWSRVAADINSSQSEETMTTPVQRGQSISDSDLRDVNMGKALDLANQQMQLLLEQKKIDITQIQPSGIEILTVKAAESDISMNGLSPTSSAETVSQMEPSETNSDSYEEFEVDELISSNKMSVISVSESLPSTVSMNTHDSSEYSGRMSTDSALSARMSDRSEISSSSSSTKLSGDSVEILSISSSSSS